ARHPNVPPRASTGGPPQPLAITSASPAFNAGNNDAAAGLDFDQRGTGFARRVDTVDLGAFEVQNQPPTANVGGTDGTLAKGLTLNLSATDSAADMASGFVYTIDWGDGSALPT